MICSFMLLRAEIGPLYLEKLIGVSLVVSDTTYGALVSNYPNCNDFLSLDSAARSWPSCSVGSPSRLEIWLLLLFEYLFALTMS